LELRSRMLWGTNAMTPDPPEAPDSKYAPISDDERMRRMLKIADLPDDDAHLEEFASLLAGQEIQFNDASGRVMPPAEQAAGEATLKRFFEERDALPEGSPESKAVALKIFDFTFGGHKR